VKIAFAFPERKSFGTATPHKILLTAVAATIIFFLSGHVGVEGNFVSYSFCCLE
jgi:hypothetical protein